VAKLNQFPLPATLLSLLISVAIVSVSMCGSVNAEGLLAPACIRTTTMTQYEPQGIRFVVSENDCDTLGNSVYSTIYASDAHGHHRVALIKFGPDERSPPPTISIENHDTIVIAIDSVVDLVHETSVYGSYRVVYRIRQIVYPTPDAKRR
jgi:hypothetical protein